MCLWVVIIYTCVRSIILASVFTIIPLEFRTVLTVWYRMFFVTFVYLCIFALIKAIKCISNHIIGWRTNWADGSYIIPTSLFHQWYIWIRISLCKVSSTCTYSDNHRFPMDFCKNSYCPYKLLIPRPRYSLEIVESNWK